jgi:CelD/BcsL family acetyltransferase involved in cellulose biosynthesis
MAGLRRWQIGPGMSLACESGGFKYQTVTELSAIREIATEWDSLLDRSVCNRAFSSSKWFVGACRTDAALTPCVLIARRQGEIAGILPLTIDRNERILQFSTVLADYNDVIVAEGDDGAATGLIAEALPELTNCQRAVLMHLRDDSRLARVLKAVHGGGDGSDLHPVGRQDRALYIPFDTGYEGFLKSRSRVFRKGLAKTLRRARENGVAVRELTPGNFDPAGLPELFLDLHLKRFISKTQFLFPERRRFVREVFPDLLAEGRVRAFALFENDKIVGLDLCMVGPRSLGSWSGGFLPDAACWSPGTLLIHAGVKAALDARMEYDFLRGAEKYKLHWAEDSRTVSGLELVRRATAQPNDLMVGLEVTS